MSSETKIVTFQVLLACSTNDSKTSVLECGSKAVKKYHRSKILKLNAEELIATKANVVKCLGVKNTTLDMLKETCYNFTEKPIITGLSLAGSVQS